MQGHSLLERQERAPEVDPFPATTCAERRSGGRLELAALLVGLNVASDLPPVKRSESVAEVCRYHQKLARLETYCCQIVRSLHLLRQVAQIVIVVLFGVVISEDLLVACIIVCRKVTILGRNVELAARVTVRIQAVRFGGDCRSE